ncbi:MAG: AraC family transcriptional regulator [Herbinix sp.]|nr:AraC family transcriptional regulator [Herbinix sp.]
MERDKFYRALSNDINCEHKSGGHFTSRYHHHDGFEIYLFLKGEASYYIEQKCYNMKRGCLFNIRPNELHKVECFNLKVYERVSITIRTPLLKLLSSEQTDLAKCFLNRPFGEDNLAHLNEHQINEFLFMVHKVENLLNSHEYGHDIIAKSYLNQILVFVNSLFVKSTQTDLINIMPPIVNKTMQYIDNHLTESITMADVAEHVHHNPTYISRCFKKVTGVPLQQYIIYKRIILAKKYLVEGSSLNDTCRMSGFNDYSNFARTFKKQLGCSPKRYQEQPF